MRTVNESILTSTNMASALTTAPMYCNQIGFGSIQLVWTGAPVGTFSIQVSNDNCFYESATMPTSNAKIVNWTTLANSTVAAGGAAGSYLYVFGTDQIAWQWMRVVYNASSGTGTITSAQAVLKGY